MTLEPQEIAALFALLITARAVNCVWLTPGDAAAVRSIGEASQALKGFDQGGFDPGGVLQALFQPRAFSALMLCWLLFTHGLGVSLGLAGGLGWAESWMPAVAVGCYGTGFVGARLPAPAAGSFSVNAWPRGIIVSGVHVFLQVFLSAAISVAFTPLAVASLVAAYPDFGMLGWALHGIGACLVFDLIRAAYYRSPWAEARDAEAAGKRSPLQ